MDQQQDRYVCLVGKLQILIFLGREQFPDICRGQERRSVRLLLMLFACFTVWAWESNLLEKISAKWRNQISGEFTTRIVYSVSLNTAGNLETCIYYQAGFYFACSSIFFYCTSLRLCRAFLLSCNKSIHFICRLTHSVMEGKKIYEALVLKVQWSWLFDCSPYLK